MAESSSARAGVPSIGALVYLLFGAATLAFVLAHAPVDRSDFAAFYRATLAWRLDETAAVERYPNLNPPTFLLLMAPFSYLRLDIAYVVWSAVGLASLVASIRATLTARPAARARIWWLAAACCAAMPAFYAWVLGQVTWVFLYPITRAWLAPTPVRSGMWLGIVFALKPSLALMVLVLPPAVMMATAASSLALLLAGLGVTGWHPWADWLSRRDAINWFDLPHNASIWGLAARASGASDTIRDLMWAAPIVAAFGIAWWLWTRRQAHDEKWLWAIAGSLTISPLGWSFYLPLALGPLVSTWRSNVGSRMALGLLSVPLPALSSMLPLAIVTSVSTLGIVVLWLSQALHRSRGRRG